MSNLEFLKVMNFADTIMDVFLKFEGQIATMDLLKDLYDVLPGRLVKKLHIIPHPDVHKDLNHLFEVMNIAAGNLILKKFKHQEYDVIDVENMFYPYKGVDLLLRLNDGKLVAVDVTSDPNMVMSKLQVLQCNKMVDGHYVHVFTRRRFIGVEMPGMRTSNDRCKLSYLIGKTIAEDDELQQSLISTVVETCKHVTINDAPDYKTLKSECSLDTEFFDDKLLNNCQNNNMITDLSKLETLIKMKDKKFTDMLNNFSKIESNDMEIPVVTTVPASCEELVDTLVSNVPILTLMNMAMIKENKDKYIVYTTDGIIYEDEHHIGNFKKKTMKDLKQGELAVLKGKYKKTGDLVGVQMVCSEDIENDPYFLKLNNKDKHGRYRSQGKSNKITPLGVDGMKELIGSFHDKLNWSSTNYEDIDSDFVDKVTILSDNLNLYTGDMCKTIVSRLCKTRFMGTLLHMRGVVEAITAQCVSGSHDNLYRLSNYKGHASITICKVNSDLQHVSTVPYKTFYITDDVTHARDHMSTLDGWYDKTYYICTSKWRSMNVKDMSYHLKLPYVSLLKMITTYDHMGCPNLDNNIVKELVHTSLFQTVNRQEFSARSDQIRYIISGMWGDASDVYGAIKKLGNPLIKYSTEYVFILRELYLCYATLVRRKQLHRADPVKMSIFKDMISDETGSVKVAMPDMIRTYDNPDLIVSHFYVCKEFNKDKFDGTYHESLCLDTLIEEKELFNDVLINHESQLNGMNDYLFTDIKRIYDRTTFVEFGPEFKRYLMSHMREISNQIRDDLSGEWKRRFRYNIWMSSVSYILAKRDTGNLEGPSNCNFEEVLLTSIDSLLSYRAGLYESVERPGNQTCRAATSIFKKYAETESNRYFEIYKDNLPDFIKNEKRTTTLANILVDDLVKNKTFDDMYYIVLTQKNQSGGEREISTANASMRCWLYLREEVSDRFSRKLEGDVITLKDKSFYEQQIVNKIYKLKHESEGNRVLNSNDDCSRFGPNATQHRMTLMTSIMTDNEFCRQFLCLPHFSMASKRFKIPKTLDLLACRMMGIPYVQPRNKYVKSTPLKPDISDRTNRKFNGILKPLRQNNYNHSSKIFTTLETVKDMYENGEFYIKMEGGMTQGLLGKTEGISHTCSELLLRHVKREVFKDFNYDCFYSVTSDDSARSEVFNIKEKGDTRIKSILMDPWKLTELSTRIKGAMGYFRNIYKSITASQVRELNSYFHIRRKGVTPIAKFSISLFDCGQGVSYQSDIQKPNMTSSELLSKGASLLMCDIMFLLCTKNIVDQHNMWEPYFETEAINYPLDLCGLPRCCYISGMLSPVSIQVIKFMEFLDWCGHEDESGSIRKEYINYMLRNQARIVNVDRIKGYNLKELDLEAELLSIPDEAGVVTHKRWPMGRLKIEKELKVSRWRLFGKGTLSRQSMDISELVNNFYTSVLMSSGLNEYQESYVHRFCEPKFGENRKFFNITEDNMLAKILGLPCKFSRRDLIDSLYNENLPDIDISMINFLSASHSEMDGIWSGISSRLNSIMPQLKHINNESSKYKMIDDSEVPKKQRHIVKKDMRLLSFKNLRQYKATLLHGLSNQAYKMLVGDEVSSTLIVNGPGGNLEVNDAMMKTRSISRVIAKLTGYSRKLILTVSKGEKTGSIGDIVDLIMRNGTISTKTFSTDKKVYPYSLTTSDLVVGSESYTQTHDQIKELVEQTAVDIYRNPVSSLSSDLPRRPLEGHFSYTDEWIESDDPYRFDIDKSSLMTLSDNAYVIARTNCRCRITHDAMIDIIKTRVVYKIGTPSLTYRLHKLPMQWIADNKIRGEVYCVTRKSHPNYGSSLSSNYRHFIIPVGDWRYNDSKRSLRFMMIAGVYQDWVHKICDMVINNKQRSGNDYVQYTLLSYNMDITLTQEGNAIYIKYYDLKIPYQQIKLDKWLGPINNISERLRFAIGDFHQSEELMLSRLNLDFLDNLVVKNEWPITYETMVGIHSLRLMANDRDNVVDILDNLSVYFLSTASVSTTRSHELKHIISQVELNSMSEDSDLDSMLQLSYGKEITDYVMRNIDDIIYEETTLRVSVGNYVDILKVLSKMYPARTVMFLFWFMIRSSTTPDTIAYKRILDLTFNNDISKISLEKQIEDLRSEYDILRTRFYERNISLDWFNMSEDTDYESSDYSSDEYDSDYTGGYTDDSDNEKTEMKVNARQVLMDALAEFM